MYVENNINHVNGYKIQVFLDRLWEIVQKLFIFKLEPDLDPEPEKLREQDTSVFRFICATLKKILILTGYLRTCVIYLQTWSYIQCANTLLSVQSLVNLQSFPYNFHLFALLICSSMVYIVYKHWPDTREFITRTDDFYLFNIFF